MSYRHYKQSMAIVRGEQITEKVDFYSIIMAAMRRADTGNGRALEAAFPNQWKELWLRYETPGGFVSKEEAKTMGEDLSDELIEKLEFPMEGWPYN